MAARKRINLALQGGGAHGAFTWGVLDRILEEEGLEIAGISGTSAGALNAVALKAGFVEGGQAGARAKLDEVWHAVSGRDDFPLPDWLFSWMPDAGLISKSIEYSWPYMAADTAQRITSPYMWGAFAQNPLEELLQLVDFDHVHARTGPELHICATNVRTGKIKLFSDDQVSPQAVMASACLPTLFKAVEILNPETDEVEAFWDGGYMGNPALFPLFEAHLPNDVVIVNINPLERDAIPVTPPEIQNRINEISFNSSLLRELRAIEFVQRLLRDGAVQPGAMKDVRVHMVADDSLMNRLSVATKTVAMPSVIGQLKAAGRAAADAFLDAHFDDLGQRQTCDLRAMFG